MTKRRLINKKAYDEMLLLNTWLNNGVEQGIVKNNYIVSIQIDFNGDESFVVDHYIMDEWKAKIVGENYTIVSKMLIDYLSKVEDGNVF